MIANYDSDVAKLSSKMQKLQMENVTINDQLVEMKRKLPQMLSRF
jgi:hypothetical protein